MLSLFSRSFATNGLQVAYKITPELSTMLSKVTTTSRPAAVKGIWMYIKANSLQNPENKREIVCDENMKEAFGVERMGMFELAKHMNPHFLDRID